MVCVGSPWSVFARRIISVCTGIPRSSTVLYMCITFITTASWNVIRDYSNFFMCTNVTILSKLFKLHGVIMALRKLQAIY